MAVFSEAYPSLSKDIGSSGLAYGTQSVGKRSRGCGLVTENNNNIKTNFDIL